ncbi:MAG: TIGR03668 family PPOX class F420-dependent oxidoreductase [Chloroflexi bacterium]|nr:TIGR03668 family PPOX class F420-dependent oxidoreductase [Chloroflexota bacterium]
MATLDEVRPQLDSARHGYLSTASADAEPHLQPVVFQVVGEAVYIAIDEKPKTTLRLRRLTNIEENPRFALLVDRYDDDWSRLWWILLRGPADVLWPSEWDANESAAAVAALRAKYPQYESMGMEERPLLRLRPDRVTRWSASGDYS